MCRVSTSSCRNSQGARVASDPQNVTVQSKTRMGNGAAGRDGDPPLCTAALPPAVLTVTFKSLYKPNPSPRVHLGQAGARGSSPEARTHSSEFFKKRVLLLQLKWELKTCMGDWKTVQLYSNLGGPAAAYTKDKIPETVLYQNIQLFCRVFTFFL